MDAVPADERPGPLWALRVGDHPLHELAVLRQQWFRSHEEHRQWRVWSLLPPRQHAPRPQTLPCALVATHGEQGWIMCVRNWVDKDAERCCSMHASGARMHYLETFCTALDTRTRYNACENPHPCARILARCSARMLSRLVPLVS